MRFPSVRDRGRQSAQFPSGDTQFIDPAKVPPWVQWLVAAGHTIEDGRACGLVSPDEVDDLYVAVLAISKLLGGHDPERVLGSLRKNAPDVPVTPELCSQTSRDLSQLRAALAPTYALDARGEKIEGKGAT